MRKLIYIVMLLPILTLAQSSDQNWVKSKTYKQATTTPIAIPTAEQAVTQVSYLDGLGLPIQQVVHAQSNSGKDIVTHMEYDAFGRQVKEFLPYVNQSASLNLNASASTDVLSFYNTSAYENTQNPFSEKQLEESPLNRVFKQGAPGDTWKISSGHEIEFDYQTNETSDNVKLYKATATWNATSGLYNITFVDASFYAINQLYKTITKDENHTSGNNNTTQEFKNKEGQVVLKRTFADIFVNGVLTESAAKHDTYYIYDQFGNLTYVIPPAVSGTIDQVKLDNMCYQYKYDYRNRLVEKKLPGKQWEYIVYDKLDRVVATGPAYSPYGATTESNKGWMLTKYDGFNRPAYTAWYNAAVANTADRKSLQDTYNNATLFSESKTTSATTINGISTKYTNQVSPSTFILLTVNYYDTYDYPNAPIVPSTLPDSTFPIATDVKGMPTGSWVRVLDVAGSSVNELSYTLYDTKYRPVRSNTKNHLGGYTQVDSKLDWAGKTQYTLTKHKRLTTSTELITKDMFEYSAQDKLVKHKHRIINAQNLPEQLLTLNTYDELGQLISKKVGGTDVTGTNYLQKVDYSYNIRGWLNGINDVTNLAPSATENDLFAFKLSYNNPEDGIALFNGNISETFWRTDSDNVKRKYAYKYDNLNRLLEANYSKPGISNVPDNYLEKLSYDKNGNIKTLIRNGGMDYNGGTTANKIDDLIYTYDTNNLNLLKKVSDPTTNPQGFKDGVNTNDDFSYDANGNMTMDNNKDITAIIYNHLNLPTKITFGSRGTIEYIYNSVGQKLKKIVAEIRIGTDVTDYLSGFQYKNNLLTLFPHAEGYASFVAGSKGGGTFKYVFNYTDHLGNVRLSYSLDGSVLKILEENHYYAFGLKHTNYNTDGFVFMEEGSENVVLTPITPLLGSSYKYKYNGKELQEELGLNMYDYGARNYDPSIGRWMNIDPLAEQYRRWSPYNYCMNNPMRFIDPDGMGVIDPPGSSASNPILIQQVNIYGSTRNSKGCTSEINSISLINRNINSAIVRNQSSSTLNSIGNTIVDGVGTALFAVNSNSPKRYEGVANTGRYSPYIPDAVGITVTGSVNTGVIGNFGGSIGGAVDVNNDADGFVGGFADIGFSGTLSVPKFNFGVTLDFHDSFSGNDGSIPANSIPGGVLGNLGGTNQTYAGGLVLMGGYSYSLDAYGNKAKKGVETKSIGLGFGINATAGKSTSWTFSEIYNAIYTRD